MNLSVFYQRIFKTPETRKFLKEIMQTHLKSIHHVAIISSNYKISKAFYVNILGFTIIAENYRPARRSYKLDLRLPSGQGQIELFSFTDPPKRISRPEACGLRHLAFVVEDVEKTKDWLETRGVEVENIRIDEYTGKRFTFFADPDDLPIEIYEE